VLPVVGLVVGTVTNWLALKATNCHAHHTSQPRSLASVMRYDLSECVLCAVCACLKMIFEPVDPIFLCCGIRLQGHFGIVSLCLTRVCVSVCVCVCLCACVCRIIFDPSG
jgi:hypothetical protein